MAAPIVIELVATPPVASDLTDVMAASCASVAGPGGCTLGHGDDAPNARARVVVTFDADYARLNVEWVARGEHAPPAARQIAFRDADPLVERFRSAGLVAAGLVADVERSSAAASDASAAPGTTPEATASESTAGAPRDRRLAKVALSAGARIAWTRVRPWAGVALGVEVPVAGSGVFFSGTLSYDHTWEASDAGISEERFAASGGAGFSARLLDGRVDLRPRLALVAQELGASVTDPMSGRSGSGDRFLVGLAGAVELFIPIGPALGVVGGGDLAWLGDTTIIRVHDKPVTTIPDWMYGVSLGLNVRIP